MVVLLLPQFYRWDWNLKFNFPKSIQLINGGNSIKSYLLYLKIYSRMFWPFWQEREPPEKRTTEGFWKGEIPKVELGEGGMEAVRVTRVSRSLNILSLERYSLSSGGTKIGRWTDGKRKGEWGAVAPESDELWPCGFSLLPSTGCMVLTECLVPRVSLRISVLSYRNW